MTGEYFDCDPRHGGVPSTPTVALSQQHVRHCGDGGGSTGGGGTGGGSDNGSAGSGASNPDCSWRPDYSYSTPHEKAWLQSDKQLNTQALTVDANGMYTVQFGDCLSGIAQRQLQGQGNASPNKSDIDGEVQQIVQANDARYASLDCNSDLIKTGWQLLIPGAGDHTASTPLPRTDGDASQDQPAPPARQEQQDPPSNQGWWQENSDRGATVNKYFINNAYFGGNGQIRAQGSNANADCACDFSQGAGQGDDGYYGRQYNPYTANANPGWMSQMNRFPPMYPPPVSLQFGLFPRVPFMPMHRPWHGGGGFRISVF